MVFCRLSWPKPMRKPPGCQLSCRPSWTSLLRYANVGWGYGPKTNLDQRVEQLSGSRVLQAGILQPWYPSLRACMSQTLCFHPTICHTYSHQRPAHVKMAGAALQLGEAKAHLEAGATRSASDFEAAAAEMAAMKGRQAELKAELVRCRGYWPPFAPGQRSCCANRLCWISTCACQAAQESYACCG